MKGKKIIYSAEELDWIQRHSQDHHKNTHQAFVAKFDRPDVALSSFSALCKRNGWMTGRTGRFETGRESHNKGVSMNEEIRAKVAQSWFKKGTLNGRAIDLKKPIGHERTRADGYIERKVNNDKPFKNRWQAVHRINWEAVNGPVPEGHALKCLDGDKSNTDPSNWEAVPRALLPRLAGGRWGRLSYDNASPQVRPALLTIAKLEHAARKAGA